MANTFLKAEKIVKTGLGLLQREIVLPSLVWHNAGGSFKGAAGDTITLKVPARTASRTRALRPARTGTNLVEFSDLTQLSVDVTLDQAVYNAVTITDEELTLDIETFGEDILAPQVRAVAEGVENYLAAELTGAPYTHTVELDVENPYNSFIDARKFLNDQNVPMSERVVVVGSGIEAAILKSKNLVEADKSGSDSALRDAQIGRFAGMPQIYVSNALPEDFGVMFHRTAFVLNLQAPAVPSSVGYGSAQSYQGLALRWMRDYDFQQLQDRSLVDVYIGANTVVDPEENAFVRAVKFTLPTPTETTPTV